LKCIVGFRSRSEANYDSIPSACIVTICIGKTRLKRPNVAWMSLYDASGKSAGMWIPMVLATMPNLVDDAFSTEARQQSGDLNEEL
jgi:hypothetical protein